MIDRRVVVKKLNTKPKGRIICISDIHGNLDAYLSLLKKVQYKPNYDRLMLLGDIIEKGDKNLETLKYIMNQTEFEDVHVLMGNCDFTCKNALFSYRLDFFEKILSLRKKSIIHEMAHSIGIEFYPGIDMASFNQKLRKHFLKELSFCSDLPHIIETPDTIFSHAAIMNEETYGDDFKEVMTTSFFLKKRQFFTKKVIVGHLPVTEYCKTIAKFDPIYDADTNVYSIDGGNIVKKAGQLNALIIDGNTITVDSYDNLKEVQVLHDVNPNNQLPLFVTWNNAQIDIIKQEKKQSYVYNKYLNRKFWVENEFISNNRATDYTNYQMPLKKGEYVKLVFTYQDKAQIKKNGVLGWTYLSNLDL